MAVTQERGRGQQGGRKREDPGPTSQWRMWAPFSNRRRRRADPHLRIAWGVVGARVSPPLRRRRDAFAREADEQSVMSKKVSIGKNITAYGWPICKRI
uniref:Uncharacterized protein n=1 Tax=Oryza nivara TaxID=4536 RepID=A0A0E0HI54_ORYNI